MKDLQIKSDCSFRGRDTNWGTIVLLEERIFNHSEHYEKTVLQGKAVLLFCWLSSNNIQYTLGREGGGRVGGGGGGWSGAKVSTHTLGLI